MIRLLCTLALVLAAGRCVHAAEQFDVVIYGGTAGGAAAAIQAARMGRTVVLIPIRMEPVFMILGQSAATAAALAIEGDLDVQAVAYERLRDRLQSDGQILKMPAAR